MGNDECLNSIEYKAIFAKDPIDVTEEDLVKVEAKSHILYSALLSLRFKALRRAGAEYRVKMMTDRELLEDLYMRGFEK